jgi:hypothetical protein
MILSMSFLKRIQPNREGRPIDWLIAQTNGKFFAMKEDFSEQYDPEVVSRGNPTLRIFRYRFPKERAKQLVHKLNAKSPLTKVTMVEGKMVPAPRHEELLHGPARMLPGQDIPLQVRHQPQDPPRRIRRTNGTRD